MIRNVARVRDGIVVNLEAMDDDWLAIQQAQCGDSLIIYGESETPQIGLGYDEESGEWEQPPCPPSPERVEIEAWISQSE
jgi:hypothetical protein